MPTALETYLGSNEVKKLIVNRSVELRLPLSLICLDLDIDYNHLMKAYINSNENNMFEISEMKFTELLSSLGIELRTQFLVNKKFDHVSKQEYLRNVFNNKK